MYFWPLEALFDQGPIFWFFAETFGVVVADVDCRMW